MYYVYFLLLKNKNVYKGSTADLKQRLAAYQRGLVRSTNKQEPKLIGYEVYKKKSDAVRREEFLKTTEGRRLFRQQYRDTLADHGVIQ